MSTRVALKAVAAGFLMSVLVWSLLPGANGGLHSSEWQELPEGFSSSDALAILQAQAEAEQQSWIQATGRKTPEIDALAVPPAAEDQGGPASD